MATVNFLYRSTKENAPLNSRLLFRENEIDYILGAKTEFYIYSFEELKENGNLSGREFCKKYLKGSSRDIDIQNKKADVTKELNKITNHILSSFTAANIKDVIGSKDWLKDCLDNYYRPFEDKSIPTDLISFIDYYVENKLGTGKEAAKKKYNVVKNKMIRFEAYRKRQILIEDIDEGFKNEFEKYYQLNKYSENTIQREFVTIKTFCFYAKYKGLKISNQLEALNFKREKVKHIYLTNEDLDAIKKVELPHDYLKNARDWLLISVYTGQRISDFMRFKKGMIDIEEGKYLLEFTQVKTGTVMTIPVPRAAREILNKNKGEFPRKISDQKYNEYIKQVCKLASIEEKCIGKKRVCIAPEKKKPSKNDYRDITGEFEKWELVSSHIGRRTFATLNYGSVPTSYLIAITGHSSESQFLNYIQKSEKDKAKDAYKYFD